MGAQTQRLKQSAKKTAKVATPLRRARALVAQGGVTEQPGMREFKMTEASAGVAGIADIERWPRLAASEIMRIMLNRDAQSGGDSRSECSAPTRQP